MVAFSKLVAKADNVMTTLDMTPGSLLSPQQGRQFVKNVFDLSGLSKRVSAIMFTSQQYKLSLFDFTQQLIFPHDQGIDHGRYASFITSDVELSPFKYKAVVKIPFEVFEYNVEGAALENTIRDQIFKKIGNEIEFLGLHGNKDGPSVPEVLLDPKNGVAGYRLANPTWAKVDGWLKRLDGYVYDAENENKMKLIFDEMYNALPDQFKQDPALLKFLVSDRIRRQYIYQTSERATPLMDQMLMGIIPASYAGSEVLGLPLFPANAPKVEQLTLSGTTPASLLYSNIVAANLFVNSGDLDSNSAEYPYAITGDYLIDETAGTIARTGGSTMPSGEEYKISYNGSSEAILGDPKNLLAGMNTNTIRTQRDTNILENTYILTFDGDIDINILRPEAMRKAINIKQQAEIS
jgi:hypothetical protein